MRCIIRSVRPFALFALLCIALLCIVAPPATIFAAPERPEITGIALVRIRVSNMDASRTFYAKRLACRKFRKDVSARRPRPPAFRSTLCKSWNYCLAIQQKTKMRWNPLVTTSGTPTPCATTC